VRRFTHYQDIRRRGRDERHAWRAHRTPALDAAAHAESAVCHRDYLAVGVITVAATFLIPYFLL
jgi:aminoglycoside/choline kinase family phosphotransferase